jgi:predicted nucleotidyltransferase
LLFVVQVFYRDGRAVNAFAIAKSPLCFRNMTVPVAKARLLEQIAAALSTVPNVRAVALGGSHARGTHRPDSDLDIGIYYRESQPLAIDAIRGIAKRFSKSGSPTVTDFYDWGPFVNGGAWIDNAVCKIDFLYRNLDQLERVIAAAHRGEWQHSFDQHPPFGFRSVTLLGEIHVCKPLLDPENVLGPMQERVAAFPPALRARIVQDMLWIAEFSFTHAHGFAEAGDVPNTVGCMTRIYHCLVQTLYALNETYFLNDKRSSTEIESFATAPKDFCARVSAILASPGDSAGELGASLKALKAVFAETVALANGAYAPKFRTT